jgi:hypothetical protein
LSRSIGRATARAAGVLGCATALALGGADVAGASGGGVGPEVVATVKGAKAKLVGGRAVAPAGAPARVARAIEAANRIVKGKPYCYGGGHGAWNARCYDCSGTVSYALGDRGARVIDAPMPSGSFTRWGERGRGRWITVYANGGHMYAVIAGLRLDTSMTAGEGPGWSRTKLRQGGFAVRHPRGL